MLAILPSNAVLIAAISGRSLAAAARRAGLRPLVADLFNDADTLALADRAVKLSGSLATGIDGTQLIESLKALAGADKPLVILGSGFERNPDMIEAISRAFRLAGNSAETVRIVKDPAKLADICAELRIPHPDIRFDRPDDPDQWVLKSAGAAGGSHVQRASTHALDMGRYYQRFVRGTNLSALFLANGETAITLGFSRQWVSPSRSSPYRYGGAVRLRHYRRDNADQIRTWLSALTRRTGLVGLCSADFITHGATQHLIEINPRPGATLDIFDTPEAPLIVEHLRASMGHAVTRPSYRGSAAAAIAYTNADIGAFPHIDWPDLTADHQIAGTALKAGDPVCTVFATAGSARAAMKAVKERVDQIAANWRRDFP